MKFFGLIALLATGSVGPAVALSIPVPSCLTDSTGLVSYLHSFQGPNEIVLLNYKISSNDEGHSVQLVNCSASRALTVSKFQFAFEELGGERTHRAARKTIELVDTAIRSGVGHSLHTVRDLLKAQGGNGLIGGFPDDQCGCEMAANYNSGATQ